MKKLILILSVMIGLYACNLDGEMPTIQTTYTVTQIKLSNNIVMCNYYVITSGNKDLNTSDGWFCDSIGQYKVGDKLVFQLQNNCGRYKIIK